MQTDDYIYLLFCFQIQVEDKNKVLMRKLTMCEGKVKNLESEIESKISEKVVEVQVEVKEDPKAKGGKKRPPPLSTAQPGKNS